MRAVNRRRVGKLVIVVGAMASVGCASFSRTGLRRTPPERERVARSRHSQYPGISAQ